MRRGSPSTWACRALYLAGMVHDIGKIGVRDDVLLKQETLDAGERRKIMEHPKIAEKILAPIGFEKAARYAAAHRENIDGTGYPDGLKGDEIPPPARLLAIADTYDVLRHARPYKEALAEDEVRRTMDEMAGKKWDSELLARFWNDLDAPPDGPLSHLAAPGEELDAPSGTPDKE